MLTAHPPLHTCRTSVPSPPSLTPSSIACGRRYQAHTAAHLPTHQTMAVQAATVVVVAVAVAVKVEAEAWVGDAVAR